MKALVKRSHREGMTGSVKYRSYILNDDLSGEYETRIWVAGEIEGQKIVQVRVIPRMLAKVAIPTNKKEWRQRKELIELGDGISNKCIANAFPEMRNKRASTKTYWESNSEGECIVETELDLELVKQAVKAIEEN